LGFSKERAEAAYKACDRNAELAASYLFETMEEEEAAQNDQKADDEKESSDKSGEDGEEEQSEEAENMPTLQRPGAN